MTLKKLSLKRIPEQYKLEYLRSYKQLMRIRESLKGFYPQDEKDMEWLRLILKEYQQLFIKISDLNKEIKKRA